MENEELIKLLKNLDLKDSIEVGTPAKGGAIKVYLNGLNMEESKQKILNMIELRAFATEQIELKFGGK